MPNDDTYVESKSEHYSIYYKMRARGYDKVYINPAMAIKYQSFSILKIPAYLSRRLRFLFRR
jgi:hypothetical protein